MALGLQGGLVPAPEGALPWPGPPPPPDVSLPGRSPARGTCLAVLSQVWEEAGVEVYRTLPVGTRLVGGLVLTPPATTGTGGPLSLDIKTGPVGAALPCRWRGALGFCLETRVLGEVTAAVGSAQRAVAWRGVLQGDPAGGG